MLGPSAASGVGSAALSPALLGLAGVGRVRRDAGSALPHALLCSALPLLAGSRAEGVPSYPDVRSGLSGGGGEAAACAAITRETAPSCHQLPSRGVLRRCACWRRPGATSGNSGQQPPAGAPQTHPPLPTGASRRPPSSGTHARSQWVHIAPHTRPRCGAGGVNKSILYLDDPRSQPKSRTASSSVGRTF